MRIAVGLGLAVVGLVLFPAVVAAHGVAAAPPSDLLSLFGTWSFDPTVQVPLLAAAVGYVSAVRAVNRAHPANPVPVRRSVAFLLGIAAIELALQSPIEHYDTTLFSVHMVQHILLTLIAAPLIAGGAPITLLLRFARPEVRRRWILPVLHSRVVRAVTHPVISWLVFAAVMWGTHFSPVFNASLEDPLLHQLEHAGYLIAALLFWWPIVGLDPSPWRLPYPIRAMYAFLQMPQNTFLALAIYSASDPMYPHYATLARTWGPTVLEDQQMAGGLMWIVGDLVFLVAILFVVAQWMRQEDRDMARVDARADADRAELTRREGLLADRLASERAGDGQARR
jgi:cytochrome c oxidase assembly factor CtaG